MDTQRNCEKSLSTILLIDDESTTLRVLAKALRTSLGCEVLTACGPNEAAALYDRADLVLTDWLMPDGGGARVLVECGKPVIVMSATEVPDHPNCIDKPASIAVIERAIKRVIRVAHQ